jgi:uncharacterized protein YjaZ
MNDSQLFGLLGHATADIWGNLSRDLQEAIFESATRNAPEISITVIPGRSTRRSQQSRVAS